MNELLFVTGNPGKVIGPAKELARLGVNLIHRGDIEVPELQADTAEEVAQGKAEFAWKQVGQPVMVNDAALHIDKLGGFPGTNVKQVTQQIGLDGYLRLMVPWDEVSDRICVFVDAWALAGHGGQVIVFTRSIKGQLSLTARGKNTKEQKSILWQLFIPDGFDKTLAEMSDKELIFHRQEAGDIYPKIADWLKRQ